MKDFENIFNLYIEAGAPVLQVVTYEWERLYGFSIKLSKKLNISVYVWSSSLKLKKWNFSTNSFTEDSDLSDPLDILGWFYNLEEQSILILEDFHPYIKETNSEVIRWIREIAKPKSNNRSKTLIIQTPFLINVREFDKEIPILEIPLPGEKQLLTIFDRVTKDIDEKTINDNEKRDIIQATLGMSVMEAELCFKKIIAEKKRLTKTEISLIITEKEQIIKKGGVLEYFHPTGNFNEVGGMELLKDWLSKRGRAFSTDAKDFGLTAPKGVLLLGVPGCGKSLLAKTISNEWNLPLIKFDLGKVFAGIVGESESNMRKALQLAETISPSIMWIDEIEKGLSGTASSGETDGGTTSRVFGNLLSWMQDKKEPVFIIATANNIENLPPELLRKGRFDEIFFVDLPSSEERKDIFKIHINKRKRKPKDFDLNILAQKTVGFSGAEIEEAINEGMYIAYNNGDDLKTEDIVEAVEKTYPLSKTMKTTIDSLRKWATVRARMSSKNRPEELPDEQNDVPKLKREERENPFIC
ncbi:AAA family ATPase [bacterium]|nr:AAA family ATPase [bacterium]